MSHRLADHETSRAAEGLFFESRWSMLSHVELLELQFDHSGAMRSDLRRPGVCLRHPGGTLGLAMGSGYRLRCSACSWRYVVVTLKPHRRPVQSVPGNDNLVMSCLGCIGLLRGATSASMASHSMDDNSGSHGTDSNST